MSSKSIISTALIIGFIAVALTACDDNKNNRSNYGVTGTGTTINVQGAIAEGGDGGDGGNAANQGGKIAQDGSIAADVDIEGTGLTAPTI